MLLKNEYTKIKEANDLSLKTLRGENRATINDLGKRLEALTWNCYEIERIKKDLIDMAARCEAATPMPFYWNWPPIFLAGRRWIPSALGTLGGCSLWPRSMFRGFCCRAVRVPS